MNDLVLHNVNALGKKVGQMRVDVVIIAGSG